MAFRWAILILIGAVLASEGYLILEKYYFDGPLSMTDWSGRIMTLDEKEQLFGQLREKLNQAGQATSYELARMVRSGLDPLAVLTSRRVKAGLKRSRV